VSAGISRVKGAALGLFAVYWVIVVLVWLIARPDFDQVAGLGGGQLGVEIPLLVALSALLTFLSIGVLRGWRWTFWVILLAYLAGILRVPAAALELAGTLPRQGPAWYVVLTAIVGLAQFAVAVAMLAGYRRSGPWGD
jgi:hypothetical protein